MNKLDDKTRTQIIQLLCEGMSIRAVSRSTGCSKNTITKLFVDAGKACHQFHDQTVNNLKSQRVQCDEIWSFTYAKEKNVATAKKAPEGAGDTWTWTALDSDSKLLISWLVGGRSAEYATEFMNDVASRLTNKVQLTTDGHKAYLEAVEDAFGGNIDYVQLIKLYGGGVDTNSKRYSPAECTGIIKKCVTGVRAFDGASTSYVERHNLIMRMHMRRFTRLTNGFSKKVENHAYAVALHAVYYNFVKIHKTLRCTPAMAAKVSDKIWDVVDIVKLITEKEENPKARGSYKNKISN